MLFYSASSQGFYDDKYNPVIPNDAVEISIEQHQALLNAQAEGKVIGIGKDGRPVATDRSFNREELMASLRVRRNKLLRASDAILAPDFPITEEQRTQWLAWRDVLRNLPEQYGSDPASVVWPEPPTPGVITI